MKYISILILVVAACNGNGGPTDQPLADSIRAVTVVSGLNRPIHLTSPPDDDRLFVVEQEGRIRIIANGLLLPAPFLDIVDRVACCGEQGLFSVAFHPDYATNGYFFVNFTDNDGDTRVERFRVSTTDANIADPASATLILAVDQPFANHNGGQLAFGPDDMLYIGMGDGGSGGDPNNNGQNRATLLGDLLRIDIDNGSPYRIPPDNPYAGSTQFREEIWASGLRNPWRFSFDVADGMLYVADVGQNQWEEVNAVPADEAGINYGWRLMEGSHCYPPNTNESCDRTGLQLPVHDYNHSEGCSVTGGYVYRGDDIPSLRGHYFYSDYCEGWLRSFRLVNGNATEHREWEVGDLGNVLSFGQDNDGEIYILSQNGVVRRLAP